MNTTTLTTTAAQLVEAFGATAHTAIGACRAGGERLGDFAAERWDRAFEQARPQLSPQTRRDAANARKVFGRYWRDGLALSTGGAAKAVDVLVDAAGGAIGRAQAWQASRTGA